MWFRHGERGWLGLEPSFDAQWDSSSFTRLSVCATVYSFATRVTRCLEPTGPRKRNTPQAIRRTSPRTTSRLACCAIVRAARNGSSRTGDGPAQTASGSGTRRGCDSAFRRRREENASRGPRESRLNGNRDIRHRASWERRRDSHRRSTSSSSPEGTTIPCDPPRSSRPDR
jgi:hypothetical protein